MSSSEIRRRIAFGAAAVLCLALAVVLLLLGVDVARWDAALRSDDVTYRTKPDDETLWRPHLLAPFGVAGEVLAVGDDVQLRKALRALRAAHLDEVGVLTSDPRIAISRNEATARLEAIASHGPGPVAPLASSRPPRRDRACPICDGDAGPRSAAVEHRLELSACNRAGFRERRGEGQPGARVPARTWRRDQRGRGRSEPDARREWREGRRRRPGRERVLTATSLSFLTPVAALVTLGALLPLGAFVIVRRRARTVRGVLGLAEPPARRAFVAVVAVLAAGAFLGVAAAQPVVERTLTARARTDTEAFVVVDVSRSMLGKEGRGSPMRIERAKEFAVALRASLPEIPFGVASITDRVLPHLLPSANQDVFQATVQRSIGIEKPPPRSSVLRSATRLDALATIRTQRFFAPRARKRLVVVLTDGESQPVAVERLRSLFLDSPAIAAVFVQFWDEDERVFTGNAPEAGYRPDPSAREVLEGLATAVQGRVYDEGELGAVRSYSRERLGSGPTVVHGERGSRIALAPYFAAAALAPLVLLLWRRDR